MSFMIEASMYKKTRTALNHPFRPSNPSGNIYYARLITPLGIFYKLGFTAHDSVHARLAYKGNGDEKLLDHVFYFGYLDDAFDVEFALHSHFAVRAAFSGYCAEPDLPLFGNGQSELYIDDILCLDDTYTAAQAKKTCDNIRLAEQARTKKAVEKMRHCTVPSIEKDTDVEQILKIIEGPLLWLMRAYSKFCLFFASQREKVSHAAQEGKHYAAPLVKSVDIDWMIERLKNAHYERTDKLRHERLVRIRQMEREDGIK